MSTNTDEVLAAIDDVVADRCGHCDRVLGPDAPSGWWCGTVCQQAWTTAHHGSEQLPFGVEDRSGIPDTMVWEPNAEERRVERARISQERAAARRAQQEQEAAERRARWEALAPEQRAAEWQQRKEALQAAFNLAGERYMAVARAFVDAFTPVAQRVNAVCQAMVKAGVVPAPMPEDPRERALAHVRNRNTGPAPRRRRPPRSITPNHGR